MTRSRIGQIGQIGMSVACVVALAAVLGGCREEEQNRVLIYDKGVYAGKPDTPLSAANLQAMRDRIRYQGGTDSVGGPGAGAGASRSSAGAPDVRPPGARLDMLRARGQNQRFN